MVQQKHSIFYIFLKKCKNLGKYRNCAGIQWAAIALG